MQNFIQPSGADHRIVPVHIVQLDLDKLHFRLLVQDPDQVFGAAMEGETEMPDLSFRFLLQAPAEAVQPLVGIAVAAVLNGMQQVEIKIIQPAPFQLLVEDPVPVRFGFQAPRRQLGRHHETVPGMAFRQGFLYGLFRVPAVIDVRGVKIVHAGFQVGVRHPANVADINGSVLLGQPHHAKAQFGHPAQVNRHSGTFFLHHRSVV